MLNQKRESKTEIDIIQKILNPDIMSTENKLYNKKLFFLPEEVQDIKSECNTLKFSHDLLLKKLLQEDFINFQYPQKVKIDTQGNIQKRDEIDKQKEIENNLLERVQELNYLTFSPFALNFFTNFNSNEPNENINYYDTISEYYNCSEENENNKKIEISKDEEKIFDIINFNYDKFEINNDLLYNICHGFININKLREKNINEVIIENGGDFKKNKNLSVNEEISIKNKGDEVKQNNVKESINEVLKEEEKEISQKDADYINNFISNCIRYNEYTDLVNEFIGEMEKVSADQKEKNISLNKWKNKIKEIENQLIAEGKNIDDDYGYNKYCNKKIKLNKKIEKESLNRNSSSMKKITSIYPRAVIFNSSKRKELENNRTISSKKIKKKSQIKNKESSKQNAKFDYYTKKKTGCSISTRKNKR